jgi:tRNA A37 threonylcarbamoyladenosine synthetase subunit TsaC/SUA5/YrdC
VSTVVRVYDSLITMLREGAISRDAIAAVLEDY